PGPAPRAVVGAVATTAREARPALARRGGLARVHAGDLHPAPRESGARGHPSAGDGQRERQSEQQRAADLPVVVLVHGRVHSLFRPVLVGLRGSMTPTATNRPTNFLTGLMG